MLLRTKSSDLLRPLCYRTDFLYDRPALLQSPMLQRCPWISLEVLEKTRELLQQLSVTGRQFPVSLVKAVVSQTEDELHQILAALQAKEFLYEQSAFPGVEYDETDIFGGWGSTFLPVCVGRPCRCRRKERRND